MAAFLCGGEKQHRKDWIEKRLEELVGIFAIDCAGYAIIDNHLHVLLRIDAARAETWTAEEVARRWCRLFPIQTIMGVAFEPSESWIKGDDVAMPLDQATTWPHDDVAMPFAHDDVATRRRGHAL